jgi:hypothetical protein
VVAFTAKAHAFAGAKAEAIVALSLEAARKRRAAIALSTASDIPHVLHAELAVLIDRIDLLGDDSRGTLTSQLIDAAVEAGYARDAVRHYLLCCIQRFQLRREELDVLCALRRVPEKA